MYQILKFISRYRTFLLFLLLELGSLILIVNTHSFHQSKFYALSHFFSGGIQNLSSEMGGYFDLKKENEQLTRENLNLKKQLDDWKSTEEHTANKLPNYDYIDAKVIGNSFLKRNNFLLLNKGSNDSITPDMGVITPRGVVGITLKVTPHYTTVMSLLNAKTSLNAKIGHTNHFGSLQWKGGDFTTAQLYDVPIQAQVKKGDTIYSGAYSLFFPEDIPIGTVTGFSVVNKMYDRIDLKLFTDFSALKHVYVVKNVNQSELLQHPLNTNE